MRILKSLSEKREKKLENEILANILKTEQRPNSQIELLQIALLDSKKEEQQFYNPFIC